MTKDIVGIFVWVYCSGVIGAALVLLYEVATLGMSNMRDAGKHHGGLPGIIFCALALSWVTVWVYVNFAMSGKYRSNAITSMGNEPLPMDPPPGGTTGFAEAVWSALVLGTAFGCGLSWYSLAVHTFDLSVAARMVDVLAPAYLVAVCLFVDVKGMMSGRFE